MVLFGAGLAVLASVAFLITVVVYTALWQRFTRVYTKRTARPMPSLMFDFRGHWHDALTTASAIPDVERVRRQLRWSQVLFLATFDAILLGVLLVVVWH